MAAEITDVLIPRDVVAPNRPDAHFADEARAARGLALNVQLIDHDAIVVGDVDQGLRGVAAPAGVAVYRGWMITPERYRQMAERCEQQNVRLLTGADDFAAAHHLPNWYDAMQAVTPSSVWTTSGDIEAFVSALDELGQGPAVLKDYSKSEKAYWDEAMFIPDVADTAAATAVATRFVELRDRAFDTGFVLRRYENIRGPEARTWWIDGSCVAVSAHPDTADEAAPAFDLTEIEPCVRSLALPFVTVDVALDADSGRARVVEVGDGQVSDRPSSFGATEFVAQLFGA